MKLKKSNGAPTTPAEVLFAVDLRLQEYKPDSKAKLVELANVRREVMIWLASELEQAAAAIRGDVADEDADGAEYGIADEIRIISYTGEGWQTAVFDVKSLVGPALGQPFLMKLIDAKATKFEENDLLLKPVDDAQQRSLASILTSILK